MTMLPKLVHALARVVSGKALGQLGENLDLPEFSNVSQWDGPGHAAMARTDGIGGYVPLDGGRRPRQHRRHRRGPCARTQAVCHDQRRSLRSLSRSTLDWLRADLASPSLAA